jgi:hypothetical protein
MGELLIIGTICCLSLILIFVSVRCSDEQWAVTAQCTLAALCILLEHTAPAAHVTQHQLALLQAQNEQLKAQLRRVHAAG